MRRAAWPGLCALWIAASMAVWMAGVEGKVIPDAWLWNADTWRQQPWTLWSAPLLHFLWPHLVANGLGLAALAVLGAGLQATPRDALALALAWPLGTLALVAFPGVGGFYGLSGLVHAATAILALRALVAGPAMRWLGLLLAGGLMAKLALERAWVVPVGFDSGWGFNVVFAAHLAGAAVGAGLALILQAFPERREAATD